MRLLLSYCLAFLFIAASSKAQTSYTKPDFAVQYVSYFGIGSESVQKAAVIGCNAANYALMQQALPEWTDQGLGIPVYFYKNTLETCGADKLIQKFLADYKNLNEKQLGTRLLKIRETIMGASISKSLINQLKNAIAEFYKGKKIRLSSSPNFQSTTGTFSITSSIEDLTPSIAQIYASFWDLDAVKTRFSNKNLDPQKLALGILLTQGFEYGYAIGRVQTDYTTPKPSILILSKRESSTERIGFSSFDSKWYQTYEKAKKTPIFVDNAALTPTVRELQKVANALDPLLRRKISASKILSNKDYTVVFTFVIKKAEKGKFILKLQQPELQLKKES